MARASNPVSPSDLTAAPGEMQNNPGVDASSSHRAGRKMFYRPKEAREVLGIGTTTLYALMKQGKLQRRKIGGATVIPASSIEAYAAEIEAQAA